MGKLLRDSLRDAPVVRYGAYDYFVHPLTDGVPAIAPALLDEVVSEIVALVPGGFDRIVTVEAMGIPVGTALSLRTGIPLTIVRKRRYGLPGEIALGQTTGYSKGDLFVNGLARGDRVLLVDDVVSTGGTLAPLLAAFAAHGIELADVVVIFEKGEGRRAIERRFGRPIRTLQAVEVRDGRVVPVDADRAG